MYLEEKIIDGKLMYRILPDGKWRESVGTGADVVKQLLNMQEEQRINVLNLFCLECGNPKPYHQYFKGRWCMKCGDEHPILDDDDDDDFVCDDCKDKEG